MHLIRENTGIKEIHVMSSSETPFVPEIPELNPIADVQPCLHVGRNILQDVRT